MKIANEVTSCVSLGLMKRNLATDSPLIFKGQHQWDVWLAQNGTSSSGVWMRIAKKDAKHSTISYASALETALCYGWIDGQKRADDENYWLQRFSPRSERSIWSKINREKAEALIRTGRMRPPGLRAIELARKDGRWERAYASASIATIPPDLAQALAENPKAQAFFATLNSQNRYAILFRIQRVKKAETRARKIAQFVDMLSSGERIHPQQRSAKRDDA